jgi:hypothetical protein
MMSKVNKVLLMILVASLAFAGPAYAEEDTLGDRLRATGEITGVDLEANTFSLRIQVGEDLRFMVSQRTRFRSLDGSIQELGDLEEGMRALVIGAEGEGGTHLAQVVFAARLGDLPERMTIFGEITGVVLAEGSFNLKKRDGEVVTIQTKDRTRFKSRDGSTNGLEDLEEGMVAIVVAIKQEEGGLLALVVTAGYKEDLPNNLKRYTGDITNVVPSQNTFTLQTGEGEEFTFQCTERTRFRGRDGSVTEIHDLKKEMKAVVAAVEQEDGTLMTILVIAWKPQDRPDRPKIEVMARGQIISIGDHSFTLEKQDGERMTFTVDGSTRFKSRDDSVSGFDDLQVGMATIVAAKKLGNEQLKAVWVGVGGHPSSEKSTPDTTSPFQRRPVRDNTPLQDP